MTALHDAEIEAVGDGLDAGRSLPARWYADPATLEVEQELIFRRSWQYAGRADQVAEPGAFITAQAGPVPSRSCAAGTACCARSSTSAGTAATMCSRARDVLVAAVPVPRLDLRPRRRAAQDPPRRGARPSSAGSGCCPPPSPSWGPFVFVHPEPTRRPSPSRWASCRRARRAAASTSTGWPSAGASRGRSTPTGRSASRTTSSATTARSRTPGWRRRSTSPPGAYALETHPTFSVQKGRRATPACRP